jgi:hypothetical protein
MSATDDRRDELAARALSRLDDPPLPEGFAERIAARATATAQIGIVPPSAAPDAKPLLSRVATPVPAIMPVRNRASRRRIYAAASIAVLLLASAGFILGRGATGDASPPQIAKSPAAPSDQFPAPQRPRLADALPPAAQPSPQQSELRPPTAPTMVLPVPLAPPPELAAAVPPAGAPPAERPPADAPAEEEQLAHTGPQTMPGNVAGPVYGPPVPGGLGIAGGPGRGPVSLPGETGGRESHGPSKSASSPGMSPPSTSRGPGPRL